MWRKTSICHIRSEAWTNPWAKKRSSGVSAYTGDPGVVADHVDGRGEPGETERSRHLRLRAHGDPGQQAPDRHGPDGGDDQHDDEQDRQQAADDAHGAPLLLLGGLRRFAQCDQPTGTMQRAPG
jgi:hypothetical protein